MTLIFRHNQYQETSQNCVLRWLYMCHDRIENVINFFISCDVAMTRICCGTSIMTIWFIIKYTIYFHSISCSVHGRKWYREGWYTIYTIFQTRSKIYMTSEMGKLSCVSILHPWNHLNTYSVNTFVLHENIWCSSKHILQYLITFSFVKKYYLNFYWN